MRKSPLTSRTPDEEETPEEEPELTEEQKRRLRIEQAVEESTIWAADEEYNNFFTEALLKSRLGGLFVPELGQCCPWHFGLTLTQMISD